MAERRHCAGPAIVHVRRAGGELFRRPGGAEQPAAAAVALGPGGLRFADGHSLPVADHPRDPMAGLVGFGAGFGAFFCNFFSS